jgi:hypothetical protein
MHIPKLLQPSLGLGEDSSDHVHILGEGLELLLEELGADLYCLEPGFKPLVGAGGGCHGGWIVVCCGRRAWEVGGWRV